MTLSFERKTFTKGQKVICNGYPGTIATVCTGDLEGMYEVRVPGGLVCVCGIQLTRENPDA